MSELVKITEQNGQRAVLARELHQFLEVGRDFSTWIKGRIEEYSFIEMEKIATQAKTLPFNKNKELQAELFELIRNNLVKGDIVDIAKEKGLNKNTLKSVLYYGNYNDEIVKALYERALSNKNKLRSELQIMINELKK